MAIDRKYIRVEGLISKTEILDFPNYFFDVLLGDAEISRLIVAVDADGRARGSDNEASCEPLGKEFWDIPSSPPSAHGYSGLILFKLPTHPFMMATIKVGNSDWGSYANIAYVTHELKKGSFGDVIFKGKLGGPLGLGNPVDMEIKGDDGKVPGLSTLRKDQDLINKIRILLLSRLVDYKDFIGNQRVSQIGFSVLSNPFGWITGDTVNFGIINTGFSTNLRIIGRAQRAGALTDYASLCKMSFLVVHGIAEHLKGMWAD